MKALVLAYARKDASQVHRRQSPFSLPFHHRVPINSSFLAKRVEKEEHVKHHRLKREVTFTFSSPQLE